jgi:hypothetical protein
MTKSSYETAKEIKMLFAFLKLLYHGLAIALAK